MHHQSKQTPEGRRPDPRKVLEILPRQGSDFGVEVRRSDPRPRQVERVQENLQATETKPDDDDAAEIKTDTRPQESLRGYKFLSYLLQT